MKAQAVFKIAGWDEVPFSEVQDGGKLTRATVAKSYAGDIDGQGVLEYIMAYRQDGSAVFYGLERITGHLGGRPGSFVLRHTGTFERGTMRQESLVMNGSGTGGLIDLRGECTLTAGHQAEYPFVLDYEIE